MCFTDFLLWYCVLPGDFSKHRQWMIRAKTKMPHSEMTVLRCRPLFIATLFNYLVCFDFDKKLAPNMLQLNHLKITSGAYTL